MANVIAYNDHDNSKFMEAAEVAGTYTFVAADDTAGTKTLTVVGAVNIKNVDVTVRNASGEDVTDDLLVTFTGNTITIADGAVKKLTATDVAFYTAVSTATA